MINSPLAPGTAMKLSPIQVEHLTYLVTDVDPASVSCRLGTFRSLVRKGLAVDTTHRGGFKVPGYYAAFTITPAGAHALAQHVSGD